MAMNSAFAAIVTSDLLPKWQKPVNLLPVIVRTPIKSSAEFHPPNLMAPRKR
jgi:hypothetical protein